MKVLCTGGGSGGHIYPALAILDELQAACQAQSCPLELLWLGRRRGMSQKLVTATGIPYRNVVSGQIWDVNPLIGFLSLIRLAVGTVQALWRVARFRPDLCLATGGNAAAPGALASYLLGVPLFIFMPDAAPGLTVRGLRRLATAVLVTSEAAGRHFPGKAVLTGYPVRADLQAAMRDRRAARAQILATFGLQAPPDGPALPLLLVMGGSQGARSLNRAIVDNLSRVLPLCLLLHVTGEHDFEASRAKAEALVLAPELQGRYAPVPYLHAELASALAAADAAVLRAGASVLGEIPISGTPAILVPHAGGHQWANAQALLQHEACLALDDTELATRLVPVLTDLLTQSEMRRDMTHRLQALARPAAARLAAQTLMQAVQAR